MATLKFAAALLLTCSTAFGAEPVRVLIPIYLQQQTIAGANGTQWGTLLSASNTGGKTLPLGPCAPGFPQANCVPAYNVAKPGVSRDPISFNTAPGGHGQLVWLNSDDAPFLRFSLSLLEHGRVVAQLPVARDGDFAPQLQLLSVPVSRGSRTTVRIYGVENVPATVRIGNAVIDLAPSIYVAPGGFPFEPAYAAVDVIGDGPADLTIVAEDGRTLLYAFATTVDNATGAVVVTSVAR
jgi:hypothetical protein